MRLLVFLAAMVWPSMLAGFVDVAEQFGDFNEPCHGALGLLLQPLVVLPEILHLYLQHCLVLFLLWEAIKHNDFQGRAFSLCIGRTHPRHMRGCYVWICWWNDTQMKKTMAEAEERMASLTCTYNKIRHIITCCNANTDPLITCYTKNIYNCMHFYMQFCMYI